MATAPNSACAVPLTSVRSTQIFTPLSLRKNFAQARDVRRKILTFKLMELKDFISQTLINIVQGVEEANKKTNRFLLASNVHNRYGSGQEVEFDVAVMVNQDSQANASGKIGVALASISGDIKTTELNQNIHKMKFKVFIGKNEFKS